MTRTQTAPAPPAEPKTHRNARRKPVRASSESVAEFDAAAHHKEIAQIAYRNWLERSGSAEEDWLKAEIEVRARHTR